MEWLLKIIDDFINGDAKKATEEYDCTDTMLGVFKVNAVSFIVSQWSQLPMEKITALQQPDMSMKLLRLRLHEAKAFEVKASASASWFQKLKASASASAS